MKTKEIKGILHDLLELNNWKNPLHHIWIRKKFEMDLLKGKISYLKKDSLSEFYKEKRKWFIKRVKNLKGNLKKFQKAIIRVYGAKEKIEIIYNNKEFQSESVYGKFIEDQSKLKKSWLN